MSKGKRYFYWIQYFFKYIIFSYKRCFLSSKYIVSGHCRQCGACCRDIVFIIGKKYVSEEEEFEKLKQYKKIYKNFFISGRQKDGTLIFTCKSLTEDNKCRDYKFRSLYCRNYPWIIPEFMDNTKIPHNSCGYKLKIKKKFKDFLNKS